MSGESDAIASIQNSLKDVAIAVAEGKLDPSVYDFLSGLVRSKPCDDKVTLKPPEGWRTDTDCEGELGGDNSTCETTVCTRTYDDILAMDVETSSSALRVRGATEEEEAFIRTAWALLVHNVDLIRWVFCWLLGEDEDDQALSVWEVLFPVQSFIADLIDESIAGEDEGGCVIGMITGSGLYQRVTVYVRDGERFDIDGDPEGNTESRAWSLLQNPIYLYREGSSSIWLNLLANWGDSVEGSRMCALFALAEILFHETLHLCLREPWPRHNTATPKCDRVYMAMQMFQFALVNRYPESIESSTTSGAPDRGCYSEFPFLDDEHRELIPNYYPR